MAISNVKGDLIKGAFSQLRISGLTVDPSVEDNALALHRLETMAAEFLGRNIGTGYALENEPDANTPHNLDRKYWYAYEVLLAARLMPDFGKGMQPDVTLIRMSTSALSFLVSSTAVVKRVQHSVNMPTGKGNRFYKYYPVVDDAPVSGETKVMYINGVNHLVERFDAYLKDAEDILSYVITSDDEITVSGDVNATPNITYTVTAGSTSKNNAEVKMVVTTTDARVCTRIINFNILDSDIT